MKTTRTNTVKKNPVQPLLIPLNIGFSLYASKKYEGDKLLEYTMKSEKSENDHCLLDNSSWFSNLEVAKIYKKKYSNL